MDAKKTLRDFCVEFSGFCDIFSRKDAKKAQGTQCKVCETSAKTVKISSVKRGIFLYQSAFK